MKSILKAGNLEEYFFKLCVVKTERERNKSSR